MQQYLYNFSDQGGGGDGAVQMIPKEEMSVNHPLILIYAALLPFLQTSG